MRETALPTAATRLISTTLVAFALFGSFGCGDDDGDPSDGGPADDAGRGGRGGNSGGSGGTAGAAGAAIEPLKDMTAGKSCEENSDCGAGMCLMQLPGTFGAGMMDAPGGYCSGECTTNDDCGAGGTCSGAFPGIGGIGATRGRCLQSCTDTSACRTGYRCVNLLGQTVAADGGMTMEPTGLLSTSSCQPLPATDQLADDIVGSACGADEDCGAGRCMTTATGTTYPGGYCTGACLEDADCGGSGSCTPGLLGGAGTCYLNCANDGDCGREGYRCRTINERMQCVPGAAPLPDGVVGEACTTEADCAGAAMSCGTRLGRYTAPGGYCTQRCVNSTDCGSGGVCVLAGGFSGGGATPTGTCYKSCADASGCREGYTCGPAGRTGTAAMQNICSVTPPPPSPEEDAGI